MKVGKQIARWCYKAASAWYGSYLTEPLTRDAWWQQEDETDAAFAAFSLYKAQGATRSIRRVATELRFERSLLDRWFERSLLDRWSREHRWVARAAEWDRFVDRSVTTKNVGT